MSDKIRILIVDDQPLIRDGIASLLNLEEGITVLGTEANGRDALIRLKKEPADVVLMDIRMPVMDGITAVQILREEGFKGKIIMLTTFDDEEYIIKSLKAGAVGYLLKDIPSQELARAIIQAQQGIFQFNQGVMNKLLGALPQNTGKEESTLSPELIAAISALSERETDVLKLISEGLTNREIAEKIHLSEGTVKNYVSQILLTLSARDRTQAALIGIRMEWP